MFLPISIGVFFADILQVGCGNALFYGNFVHLDFGGKVAHLFFGFHKRLCFELINSYHSKPYNSSMVDYVQKESVELISLSELTP